ncbi:hypothetical protein [Anaerobium acetethylicum]|uniref:Uncharacterized protein n=1 Tax=Anaerobium acetethylicum TaxID=1619234 RepID=A0A1D3TVZ3_9FIRM|nr:hypothetical protein [Anaerobium acetethylicum]SCP98322.1 hypothetical protein SAMN05421730_101930 [Anaerobium acetethylicum]
MDEQRVKKIRRNTTIATVLTLVPIAAYLIYTIASGSRNIMVFQILVGVALFTMIILTDVVEPFLLKQFENITPEKKTAYLKYLGIDILSVACLGYFVLTMGMETTNNTGLYAALGYFVLSRYRRKLKTEFTEFESRDEQN